MKRWEHWLTILLVGVLFYFWITWPEPKADERVQEFQQVIEQQQNEIDLLKAEREELRVRMEADYLKAMDKLILYEKKISKQREQLKENEDIHELPTPELDSIVRELYGEGAI